MYIIGLDIGTTGTKATLVNQTGKVEQIGYCGYKLETKGQCVEQNPDDWWKASCKAVRQACFGYPAGEITALSVSAQGATMLAVDKDNRVIGSAITWLDTRATGQVNFLRERLGEDYVYRTTGWKLSPSLDAAKILYMKETPMYQKAARFISTIEYMNNRLTGRTAIDPTCAGIRQIYNIKERNWDERILDAIGCKSEELPELLPTGAFLSALLPEAAEELGLPQTVRVYNGAHDQYCASLGSGAVNPGEMLISTGTAWAVMGISESPIFSPSCISSCSHPIPNRYGNMVSLTGAGSAYQWIKDKFCEDSTFAEIDAEAQKRIGKNPNLIFIPWLSGNLYPYFLSESRGGFLGADLSCDKYDFALSIMESAAFSVRAAVEDFEAQGCETSRIYIMGGAAKSSVWMGILREVIHKDIYKLSITDTCALGAAAIALVREGCFTNYEEASAHMVRRNLLTGTNSNRDYYEQKYQVYRRTVEHMADFYKESR